METRIWAIFLMIFVTFLTSIAQIFYKIGANILKFDILSIITNLPLIIGIILYGTGAILFVIALKSGEVSVLYPVIATSYIWVSFLSKYLLNESLNIYKILGIIAIFAGVSLISLKSRRKSIIEYTGAV
jgi:drug/metabolite transporter (DMT)-like permease